jgi:anti-sigma B factor antagonist
LEVIKKGNSMALVMVRDRIDLANSHLLKDQLQELYDEGFQIITLDFSHATGIDSSGLGKLLLFQKKLKERNGELRIINITSAYIKKMFKMIHLYKVINIENETHENS